MRLSLKYDLIKITNLLSSCVLFSKICLSSNSVLSVRNVLVWFNDVPNVKSIQLFIACSDNILIQ